MSVCPEVLEELAADLGGRHELGGWRRIVTIIGRCPYGEARAEPGGGATRSPRRARTRAIRVGPSDAAHLRPLLGKRVAPLPRAKACGAAGAVRARGPGPPDRLGLVFDRLEGLVGRTRASTPTAFGRRS